MSIAPAPVLRDEQIFELLHDKLSALVGEHGAWTMVARSAEDTEVIFHGLKAREIATELTEAITTEQATLRGESTGEPTALSWTPAPITTWSEPAVAQPVPAPTSEAEVAEVAAASAAWIDKASATLASARLVA
ncbi:hypothetical protein [Cryobacterium aureum]|uniref:hypothetical protein n=1 Tax=Cryobacterium aureum TaxID=995037 RepID=UPI000CF41455|nr:hypothetical protein [Cryobacterium aureum]